MTARFLRLFRSRRHEHGEHLTEIAHIEIDLAVRAIAEMIDLAFGEVAWPLVNTTVLTVTAIVKQCRTSSRHASRRVRCGGVMPPTCTSKPLGISAAFFETRFRPRRQDRSRDNWGLPSSFPRQLPASPMLVLPRLVQHPFDVSVQCSHHANSREHRWPIMFSNQHESCHCSLPFFGIVFCLRQLGDVERRVAQGDELLALGQFDRLGKWTVPRHGLDHIAPATKSKAPDRSEVRSRAGVHPSGQLYDSVIAADDLKLDLVLGEDIQ
jgi:hypothetical protein